MITGICMMLLFFGLAVYFGIKESHKYETRWNDGCCECGTGMLRFRGETVYDDVGKFYVYNCSSCEHEELFMKRMD